MYRGTFGDRGTVGTEEYRGITKEEWAQRNRGHRGTLGTEEQMNSWGQKNSRHSMLRVI